MISIVPTTNYNTNFKAVPTQPNMKVLSDQISAIAAGEVIPKEAVQRSIPKILSILSSIPLIGYFANLYIIRLERAAKEEQLKQEQLKQEQLKQEQLKQEQLKQEQLKQEQLKQEQLKQEQLKQEQIEIANKRAERLKEEALKVDSNGKTMALKLLEKDKIIAFKSIIDKYPDVLLIRANDGKSCLIEAAYLYEKCSYSTTSEHHKLVDYIAEKLVSNPDYNPNEQAESDVHIASKLVAKKGDTDAHIMVRFGVLSALAIIATHPKTDLLIRNADGETCMDVALKNNEYFIINFLATKM